MTPRLRPVATVAGLLLLWQGCAVVRTPGNRRDVPLGATRSQVEAWLGKRVASRPLPDGGSVETYNARYTYGIRHTENFTFGPDGRLLDYDPPPSYGTRDDRLPVPAFREIRERCRAEHPEDNGERRSFRDYPYYSCVVSRLAIWGIE